MNLRKAFKFLIFIFFSIFYSFIYGQTISHLNNEWNDYFVPQIKSNKSSIRPFILSSRQLNSFYNDHYFDSSKLSKVQILFKKSFINIDDKDVHLEINPIFDFSSQKTTQEGDYKHFMRGAVVSGKIGNKFGFYTLYSENQNSFPAYISNKAYDEKSSWYNPSGVIPGQMLPKPMHNSDSSLSGFDYGYALGLLTYIPNENFELVFGHGNNFIGDGYRSLILSDISTPYPFFRANFNRGKWNYMVLLSSFNHLVYDEKSLKEIRLSTGYPKKTGNYNYLTYSVHPKIVLGLLEATLFNAETKYFNYNEINPIIFSKTLFYGLKQRNNVLLGFTYNINPITNLHLYGQIVIDDFSSPANRNKAAFQNGLKYYHSFGINNLTLNVEYNKVNPYTYCHNTESQAFTNYGQALTHPLGANFNEKIASFNYRYKRVSIDATYINAKINNYNSTSSNIFISENTNLIVPQNISQYQITYINSSFKYILNPTNNMQLFVGMQIRNDSNSNLDYVYFGWRTSLRKEQFDF